MNKNDFFDKFIKFFKGIIIEVAIIFGGLFLDLLSKGIVENTMFLGETIVVIPKFLNFTYVLNKRAAFGSDFGLGEILGESGVMIFFIAFTLVAIAFFGYMLFKNQKKGLLYRISFSLIISGALGNLYDRAFLGHVRDFIQFEYFGLEIFGSTTFAVFNIADACVVVGTIMLIVFILFFDETFKDKKTEDNATDNGGDSKEHSVEDTEQSQNGAKQEVLTVSGEDSGLILPNKDDL